MILNTTSKPFIAFNAPQVLACRGERVVARIFQSIDDFYRFYDGGHKHVITTIIVDPLRLEFANDIINHVDYDVRVVTLDVEIIEGEYSFIDYYDKDEGIQ